jgi:hypothetical protein
LVDLVDLAVHRNHLGAARGVQCEDIPEVVAGADDRPNDGLAVDDGVEDRQAQCRVVSGQRDAY